MEQLQHHTTHYERIGQWVVAGAIGTSIHALFFLLLIRVPLGIVILSVFAVYVLCFVASGTLLLFPIIRTRLLLGKSLWVFFCTVWVAVWFTILVERLFGAFISFQSVSWVINLSAFLTSVSLALFLLVLGGTWFLSNYRNKIVARGSKRAFLTLLCIGGGGMGILTLFAMRNNGQGNVFSFFLQLLVFHAILVAVGVGIYTQQFQKPFKETRKDLLKDFRKSI